MANSWIIDLVAENTDKETLATGNTVFVSPNCGVCGEHERNADLVGLYKAMETHKCHSYPAYTLEDFFNEPAF